MPTQRVHSDKRDFSSLETFIAPFNAQGRTESAALLIWFLQTIYRLDEVDAEDAVCDRKHDEGVDAIIVNDPRREVVLFQSKRREKLPATLGDSDLKTFVGSLAHFKSKKSVEHLISTTVNQELAKLLTDKQVADKIAAGYRLRPVFVTNVAADNNAHKYLPQSAKLGFSIDLWDLAKIGPVLKQLARDWFIDDSVKVKANKDRLFIVGAKSAPRLIYAAISARELTKLPGIEDLRLFAQNVRLGLGNTRVNTEIVGSLQDKREHPNFITFHNGLTIVAKEVTLRGGTISLEGFSVCNGCQSLLSMWENRKKLTDDLEILVRVVRVGSDRGLPELIAYRTNNQNAISLRDLSSNDDAQVHLKNSFDSSFGAYATYAIKRGEPSASEELGNEFAGRLLLALYVSEPWSAHQKYRIFGDLENRIFSFDISAEHIRLAQLIGKSASTATSNLKYERLAKYGLTQFILVFLIGQVLEANAAGAALLKAPGPYLSTSAKRNANETKVMSAIDDIARYVVTELNYFVKGKGGDEGYDYKSSFKSQTDVHVLRDEILKAYEKDINIRRAKAFALPR